MHEHFFGFRATGCLRTSKICRLEHLEGMGMALGKVSSPEPRSSVRVRGVSDLIHLDTLVHILSCDFIVMVLCCTIAREPATCPTTSADLFCDK